MFAKSTRILVVDDMGMFRQMVKQSLTEMELPNFVEKSDGLQAWMAVQEAQKSGTPFQLIISDWSMPKMKGIELLKKVRAEPWGANLPFVMLTGETEKELIMEAVQNGVTQYIIKPFTPANLKDKLKSAYDKTHAAAAKGPNVIFE